MISLHRSKFIFLLLSLTFLTACDPEIQYGEVITTSFGDGSDWATCVAVQSDGKIVVGGCTYNTTTLDFNVALVRYKPNGDPDESFGSQGKVITAFSSSHDFAKDLVIQPDGKIIIVGESQGEILLAKYNPDGNLDSSFGVNGMILGNYGPTGENSSSIKLLGDGKILIGASISNGSLPCFGIIRYNNDGSLDPGFGTNGLVLSAIPGSGSMSCYSIFVQPDGKIIAAGTSTVFSADEDVAVIRYNSDGSLDNSFGSSGMISIPVGFSADYAFDVTSWNDGKIIITGYSFVGPNGNYMVLRLNNDGTLDPSFSSDGKLVFNIVPTAPNVLTRGLVQSDGKIIIAGHCENIPGDLDYVAIRLNSDGSIDNTYADNGILRLGFSGKNGYAHDATFVEGQSLILVGNYETPYLNDSDFLVVKVDHEGRISL